MKQPTTIIQIAGQKIKNYQHYTLHQAINNHHYFEVVIDHEEIEQLGGHLIDKSKDWLGETVIISIDDNDFIGIATQIQLQQSNGYQGNLHITGYSKTILLEAGKHNYSWVDTDLKSIITETIETIGIDAEINPQHKGSIAYMVQYNETHFEFIKRLAKQYNEWLFYDGLKLVFGKPNLGQEVAIVYGPDMEHMNLSIKTAPNKLNGFSYLSQGNEQIETETNNSVSGLNELANHAFKQSKTKFSFTPNQHLQARPHNKSELDEAVKRLQAAKVANLNTIEGNSEKSQLKPCVPVIIKASVLNQGKWAENAIGQYIITQVVHSGETNGKYSNQFTGIPAGVQVLPPPQIAKPTAENQIATVISNNDPLKKGRIQVMFQWQQHHGLTTNWIRVMSPNAGASNYHSKNRGHVFIPEVGDQVMIGFRYNDPSRPFVMGSLFHGQNGAGGGNDNTKKSIITRAGHVIEFNDAKNQESITITDKNKNIIFIDTANKSIMISAPENIDIKAKNISITATENITNQAKNISSNASENISTGAGENINTHAGDTISSTATDIKQRATNTFNRTAKEVTETAEKVAVDSTKENLELTSKKQVISQSGEKIKLF